MAKMELVGMGKQSLGETEGWCITYLPEGNEAPDFIHHIFPAVTFSNYAREFGLDLDEDFEEILDIVLHEVFGGDENPQDYVEPEAVTARRGDKKNSVGRRMRRRADRVKESLEITGIDLVKERLRAERRLGVEVRQQRVQKLQNSRQGRTVRPEPLALQPPGRIAVTGKEGA
jgi:hypothetical protein